MEKFIGQIKAGATEAEVVFQDYCLENGLNFFAKKYLEQKYYVITSRETIRIFSSDTDREFKLGDLVIRQAYASSTPLINSYRYFAKLTKIHKKSVLLTERRWAPCISISFDDFFRHNSKSLPITEKELQHIKYRDSMDDEARAAARYVTSKRSVPT